MVYHLTQRDLIEGIVLALLGIVISVLGGSLFVLVCYAIITVWVTPFVIADYYRYEMYRKNREAETERNKNTPCDPDSSGVIY